MKCYSLVGVILFFCAIIWSAQMAEAAESVDLGTTNMTQLDFFRFVDKNMQAVHPRPFEFDQLPDAAAVESILTRNSRCAAAVGGGHRKYVVARLRTTHYFSYQVAAARQRNPGNRLQALFALCNVKDRYVALLQPFWQPQFTLVEMENGKKKPVDTLPYFERMHGLRLGSLTASLARVLTILHEQAHLNSTIPPDSECMLQSMKNTRWIAQNCFPDIVEPLSQFTLTEGSSTGCITHIP